MGDFGLNLFKQGKKTKFLSKEKFLFVVFLPPNQKTFILSR